MYSIFVSKKIYVFNFYVCFGSVLRLFRDAFGHDPMNDLLPYKYNGP
jgi:hypothetical protein